jgi:hypothetical protein
VAAYAYLGLLPADEAPARAAALGATWLPGGADQAHAPHARGVAALAARLAASGPVDIDAWEPNYGRAAEAQVQWEARHGRALAAGAAEVA